MFPENNIILHKDLILFILVVQILNSGKLPIYRKKRYKKY